MWKMHARQRPRAQIVAAISPLVGLPVPCRVRGYVLLLLALLLLGLLVLGEHLFEELELGGCEGEEGGEKEEENGGRGVHFFFPTFLSIEKFGSMELAQLFVLLEKKFNICTELKRTDLVYRGRAYNFLRKSF